jgi:amidase
MAGPDPRAPLSLDEPADALVLGADVDPRGARIAWSRNLGDLPVEPEVAVVLEDARAALEAMGCLVEDVEPDLTAADEAFEVLRAVGYAHAFGAMLEAHGDELKDTIVWNARVGLALTGERVGRALALQTEMFQRTRALLERYDALALPVSQVAPFPIEREWVTEIAGVEMTSYIEWMRSCSRISVTAHPAMSIPAGFTPGGLPVGLQLVGRHRGDLALLRLAAGIEQATGIGRRAPDL